MYQNITFKKQNEEMYQTNSLDLFTALYHLTYENENDINEKLNIQDNETIEQVATFERKPNFKCKFNINKYTESEKEFIQMFDFQHSHLTQNEFEKVVTIILDYRQVYATTKFDVGKTKLKLNLPIKKDAVFKKQRISKVPIHLRERIQKLLDVLKIRRNCTSEQRTTIYRKYIYISSNYITKVRIIENSTRCTILK